MPRLFAPFVLMLALWGWGRAEDLPRFVEVARQAGVVFGHDHGGWAPITILETNGAGVAFVDYDGDGELDIYAVNGRRTRLEARPGGDASSVNRLYRNIGGMAFEDVTEQAGVGDPGMGFGVAVGDYDNDGHPDLYVTNWGPNVLYHNRGDGTFEDVSQQAGVADDRWSEGVAFGDYDNDGDLDLYVAHYVDFQPDGLLWCYYGPDRVKYGCSPWNYTPQPNALFRNEGDGTFVEVAEQAGVADATGRGLVAVFGDCNGDGWVDLYVANDASANRLFLNQRDGTFEDATLISGTGFDEAGRVQASMGCAFGDYNHDGRPDLFITNFSDETNTFYHNDGDGFFTVRTEPLGLGGPSLHALSWGTSFEDLDNDGDLDLFVANGHVYDVVEHMHAHLTFRQQNQVFFNQGADGFGFVEVSDRVGSGLELLASSRGTAFGDCDNDGDIDILVSNNGGPAHLLRNDGGNRKSWLQVKLVGGARPGQKVKPGSVSNRDGVGAFVTVTAGDLVQYAAVARGTSYLSANDARLHFGLNAFEQVDRIEVQWPSGVVDVVKGVKARQQVVIGEGQGVLE